MTSNAPTFLAAWLATIRDPSSRAAFLDLGQTRRVWAASRQDDVFGVKDILERAAAGLAVSMAMPAEARLMLVLRQAEKMAEANNKQDWARAIALLHTHTRARAKGVSTRTVVVRRRALTAAVIGKNRNCAGLLNDSIIWALRSVAWADDLSIAQP